jgi:hypothetical protein
MLEDVVTQLLDRLVGEDGNAFKPRRGGQEATFGTLAGWLNTDAPPLRDSDLRIGSGEPRAS